MSNILKNKTYLYLTEFFAGVSVMAVELAASRLMAPYFSSSQVIYTIIIGTVMIAMALGNIYGGKTADKNPDPSILYRRMFIASAWIAAIPILGKYLLILISGVLILTVSTNFLAIAAFVSCMVIFVFPLFLLGTVTPSLVRYIMTNAEESGSIVGKLEAFNTIGSIIGTFLPTFVTIPAVGTSVTFIIFSGILFILALVYFISIKKITKTMIVSIIVFILCTILSFGNSFAFWEKDIKYEGESVYNYLQVTEDDKKIYLSTNVLFGVQSVKVKNDDLTGMYYDYALAGNAMAEAYTDKSEGLDILILGNGTGTFATLSEKYFKANTIDAVEIDKKISELAYEYFDMSESVNLYDYDGRAFLQAIDKKYDVILVDAYQDITIPFQMSSQEFFKLAYDHLNDNGVMIVNMNMHSDGEGSINEYLSDTILSVFPNVYIADVGSNSNRELYAAKSFDCKEALGLRIEEVNSYKLKNSLNKVYSKLVKFEGTGKDYLLTDDKAPVEILGMSIIDNIISEEIEYYQTMFKEKGIKALIQDIL